MIRKMLIRMCSLFIGAFTPSCSEQHLPGYIEKLDKLKAKGVDVVAVVAYNDPFVMSAWGKANRVKSNDVVSEYSLKVPENRTLERGLRQGRMTDSYLVDLALHDRSREKLFQQHRLDIHGTNRKIRSYH